MGRESVLAGPTRGTSHICETRRCVQLPARGTASQIESSFIYFQPHSWAPATPLFRCLSHVQVKNKTDTGLPSVNSLTLRELCGKPGRAAELLTEYDAAESDDARSGVLAVAQKSLGSAYDAFGAGRDGVEACAAIDALCESNAVEKLLSGFIIPLQARKRRHEPKGHSDSPVGAAFLRCCDLWYPRFIL